MSKEKEIQLIKQLYTNDSYLFQGFTDDEIDQIILNFELDLPVFLNTNHDIDAYKNNIAILTNAKAEVEMQVASLKPNVKFTELFAVELLKAGYTDIIYENIPVKDVIIYKLKAGMPLFESEIQTVQDVICNRQ